MENKSTDDIYSLSLSLSVHLLLNTHKKKIRILFCTIRTHNHSAYAHRIIQIEDGQNNHLPKKEKTSTQNVWRRKKNTKINNPAYYLFHIMHLDVQKRHDVYVFIIWFMFFSSLAFLTFFARWFLIFIFYLKHWMNGPIERLGFLVLTYAARLCIFVTTLPPPS